MKIPAGWERAWAQIRWIPLVLLGAALPACPVIHACTDIGCADQFSARIMAADGVLPSGLHTLEVTADGRAMTCTFPIPPTTAGARPPADCGGGLLLTVEQRPRCVEAPDAAIGEPCQQAPGPIDERFTVAGTPASIVIRQSVGGVVVFEKSVSPRYAVAQPNGPGCDPTCHFADATWTIP